MQVPTVSCTSMTRSPFSQKVISHQYDWEDKKTFELAIKAFVLFLLLLTEEFDKETGQILSGLDKLPPDLKHYVKEDNELFGKEIEEWDALQARKAQQEKLALATAAAAAAAASAASSISTSSSSPQPMSIGSSTPDNAGRRHDTCDTIIAFCKDSGDSRCFLPLKVQFNALLQMLYFWNLQIAQ